MARTTLRFSGEQNLVSGRLEEAARQGFLRPRLVPTSGGPVVAERPFASLPHETEDSVITGGTRSLVRRLLGLNLEGSLRGAKRGVAKASAETNVVPMSGKIA